MRKFCLIIVLVALVQWNTAYSIPSSSSSSSSFYYASCCSLNSWAYAHIDDIRQFTNRLKQEYSSSTSGHSMSYTPWSESIISLTGKTSEELDAICRLQGEQLVNDIRSGVVSYTVIAQPNFFEWKSSDVMQKYAVAGLEYGKQQALTLDLSNDQNNSSISHPNTESLTRTGKQERLEELIRQHNVNIDKLQNSIKLCQQKLTDLFSEYRSNVGDLEKWLNIEKTTQWQKEQQQRILNLLQQQSSITVEEFQVKIQKDRAFLMNLAKQYQVNVNEIEQYVQMVIQDLKEKGKFKLEQLKGWQLAERDYIHNLINEHKNKWSTQEYEDELINNRVHLQQLAVNYRVSVKEIEEWIIKELVKYEHNLTRNPIL